MQWKMDERGGATDLIQWLVIAGVVGGVLIFLAANFRYIVALGAICVIGLMIFGYFFKGTPNKENFGHVIIISAICLGIVGFVTVTPGIVIGVMLAGGGLWYYSKNKKIAVFVLMVGFGMLLVLAGSMGLKVLGVFPV